MTLLLSAPEVLVWDFLMAIVGLTKFRLQRPVKSKTRKRSGLGLLTGMRFRLVYYSPQGSGAGGSGMGLALISTSSTSTVFSLSSLMYTSPSSRA